MTDRIDDLLGDDEEVEDEAPAKQNNQLAAAQRKLDKALKENEELRAYKAERDRADRENSISGIFTEVGLNPKHAKLFSALNPEGDVTAEAVASFARDYALISEDQEIETPEPARQGFTPTAIPEGAPLGAKTYSVEEWRNLAFSNPVEAQKLLERGQVPDLANR
jgi:hypothetical protein